MKKKQVHKKKEKSCEHCQSIFLTCHKETRFCSQQCVIKAIGHLRKKFKPYNYDDTKIRNCQTCGSKLHAQAATGYCLKHYYAANPDIQKRRKEAAIKCAQNRTYSNGYKYAKRGWYKGYWCDSSWELAWVMYQLDHGVSFTRNTDGFKYQFSGTTRRYYPDFLVGDTYVEIKGYDSIISLAKRKQFPYKLMVLHEKEIKPFMDYAKKAYGKNFVDQYGEGARYKLKRYPNKIKPVKKKRVKLKLKHVKLKRKQRCVHAMQGKKHSEATKKQMSVNNANKLSQQEINDRIFILKTVNMEIFGWVNKAAEKLSITHAQVRRFVNKYYPDTFYRRKAMQN